MIPIPPIAVKAVAGLAMFGVVFFFGYVKGKTAVQQRWDAAVTVQAKKTAGQIIAEATHAAKSEVRYITVKGETQTHIKVVEKKVVEYVERARPVQLCAVDTDFISHWDDASRVYNAGLPRLPPGVPAASEPDQLPGRPLGATPIEEHEPNHRGRPERLPEGH